MTARLRIAWLLLAITAAWVLPLRLSELRATQMVRSAQAENSINQPAALAATDTKEIRRNE